MTLIQRRNSVVCLVEIILSYHWVPFNISNLQTFSTLEFPYNPSHTFKTLKYHLVPLQTLSVPLQTLNTLKTLGNHWIYKRTIENVTHWAHDVVATLNRRHWSWFNVATTLCSRWEVPLKPLTPSWRCCDAETTSLMLIQRRNNVVCPVERTLSYH